MFKVGDKVRRLCYEHCGVKVGDIHTVKRVFGKDHMELEGAFEEGVTFMPENFEHARIKDTKIARKMRAKEIDRIEKGWIYLKGVE